MEPQQYLRKWCFESGPIRVLLVAWVAACVSGLAPLATALLLALVIHEGGHWLTAKACGVKIKRLRWVSHLGGTLPGVGVELDPYQFAKTSPWARCVIALGGIICNLAAFSVGNAGLDAVWPKLNTEGATLVRTPVPWRTTSASIHVGARIQQLNRSFVYSAEHFKKLLQEPDHPVWKQASDCLTLSQSLRWDRPNDLSLCMNFQVARRILAGAQLSDEALSDSTLSWLRGHDGVISFFLMWRRPAKYCMTRFVSSNFWLAVVNLAPLPGLDGHTLLQYSPWKRER
mmetsp:Transcript_6646/g.12269  ORF Transcript_6646/g.12269 Transcript_6646/m.12269 type:complete len:286 (+) Transcript_6646:115-972(+)